MVNKIDISIEVGFRTKKREEASLKELFDFLKKWEKKEKVARTKVWVNTQIFYDMDTPKSGQ